MAEVLETFSADPITPGPKHGQTFHWDQWSDGRIYRVEQGKDYESQRGFLASLTKQANKKGLQVRLVRHEGAVEFCLEGANGGTSL